MARSIDSKSASCVSARCSPPTVASRSSLTRRGVRVKTKVLAHLLEPPPELLTLGLERLEALRGALERPPPSWRRRHTDEAKAARHESLRGCAASGRPKRSRSQPPAGCVRRSRRRAPARSATSSRLAGRPAAEHHHTRCPTPRSRHRGLAPAATASSEHRRTRSRTARRRLGCWNARLNSSSSVLICGTPISVAERDTSRSRDDRSGRTSRPSTDRSRTCSARSRRPLQPRWARTSSRRSRLGGRRCDPVAVFSMLSHRSCPSGTA